MEQVGCIHTAQGLEFDYAGVIIGEDLRYENGRVITDVSKRAKTDQSIKGIHKLERENPDKAKKVADEIIKNTYRTLMTRGQKGCYIYCVDKALSEYLKNRLNRYKPGIVYTIGKNAEIGISMAADNSEEYNY